MNPSPICTKQEPKPWSDTVQHWIHPDVIKIGEGNNSDFPYEEMELWSCPHCKYKFSAFKLTLPSSPSTVTPKVPIIIKNNN